MLEVSARVVQRVSGLSITCGVDADFVQLLAGAALALVVSYIVMECKADFEAETHASESVQKVIAAVETAKEQKELMDGVETPQDGVE